MSKIYHTKNHPDGQKNYPYYMIWDNNIFTTGNHPDGLKTYPYYIIKEKKKLQPRVILMVKRLIPIT